MSPECEGYRIKYICVCVLIHERRSRRAAARFAVTSSLWWVMCLRSCRGAAPKATARNATASSLPLYRPGANARVRDGSLAVRHSGSIICCTNKLESPAWRSTRHCWWQLSLLRDPDALVTVAIFQQSNLANWGSVMSSQAGSGAEPWQPAMFSCIQIKFVLIFGHRCISICTVDSVVCKWWDKSGIPSQKQDKWQNCDFSRMSLKIGTVPENLGWMVTLFEVRMLVPLCWLL